jgi:hypothetical protein
VCLSLPSLSMRPAVKAFSDFLQTAFKAQGLPELTAAAGRPEGSIPTPSART